VGNLDGFAEWELLLRKKATMAFQHTWGEGRRGGRREAQVGAITKKQEPVEGRQDMSKVITGRKLQRVLDGRRPRVLVNRKGRQVKTHSKSSLAKKDIGKIVLKGNHVSGEDGEPNHSVTEQLSCWAHDTPHTATENQKEGTPDKRQGSDRKKFRRWAGQEGVQTVLLRNEGGKIKD